MTSLKYLLVSVGLFLLVDAVANLDTLGHDFRMELRVGIVPILLALMIHSIQVTGREK